MERRKQSPMTNDDQAASQGAGQQGRDRRSLYQADPTAPATTDLTATSLLIRFFAANDRYAHQIGWQSGSQFIPLLESVEGTADDAWPPSPPLQQIHSQTLPQGPVTWGLGSAGCGHWSASFARQPAPAGAAAAWLVEWALRAEKGLGWVGTTYRLVEPLAEFDVQNSDEIAVVDPRSTVRLIVRSEQTVRSLSNQERILRLRPRLPWTAAASTLTWSYFVTVCPTGDAT